MNNDKMKRPLVWLNQETENGKWKTENGKRKTENGKRKTENGKRETGNGTELKKDETKTN